MGRVAEPPRIAGQAPAQGGPGTPCAAGRISPARPLPRHTALTPQASPLAKALGGNNGADAIAALKAKLFAAEQRAAVLEGEKRALQAQVRAVPERHAGCRIYYTCTGAGQISGGRTARLQVDAAGDLKWLLSCPGVAQASKLEEREAMPGRDESDETLSHALAHSQALAKQVGWRGLHG